MSAFRRQRQTGHAHLTIDNPKALEQLVIGASYYFDMTPVPVPAPPQ